MFDPNAPNIRDYHGVTPLNPEHFDGRDQEYHKIYLGRYYLHMSRCVSDLVLYRYKKTRSYLAWKVKHDTYIMVVGNNTIEDSHTLVVDETDDPIAVPGNYNWADNHSSQLACAMEEAHRRAVLDGHIKEVEAE